MGFRTQWQNPLICRKWRGHLSERLFIIFTGASHQNWAKIWCPWGVYRWVNSQHSVKMKYLLWKWKRTGKQKKASWVAVKSILCLSAFYMYKWLKWLYWHYVKCTCTWSVNELIFHAPLFLHKLQKFSAIFEISGSSSKFLKILLGSLPKWATTALLH